MHLAEPHVYLDDPISIELLSGRHQSYDTCSETDSHRIQEGDQDFQDHSNYVVHINGD